MNKNPSNQSGGWWSQVAYLLKTEPVMCFVLGLAVLLAVLIKSDVITIDDVSEFVATVGAVIPILLAGLALRQLVTPVAKR